MGEAETMSTSVPYTILRVRGWRKTEEDRYRASWEQSRMIAHTGLLPYDTKKKLRRPTDLMRFPWEDGYRTTSAAEMQALKEKLNQAAADFFNEPPPIVP